MNMARKGQFKKGGGRHGGRARKRSSSKSIVRYRTKTLTKYRTRGAPRRHRRHRRHGGGGGVNLLHLGLATAGLAFMTSSKSPLPAVKTFGDKIPGAKTFGTAAAIGVGALAVDRFVKHNKWLKLLGVAGVILAAAKVGEQGTDFKWVGDDDDITADIGDDDDDVGDDMLDY
jgi:hypothetical protein